MKVCSIALIFLAVSVGDCFLQDLIAHVHKASQPAKKQFLSGQPAKNELIRVFPEVASGKEANDIGIVRSTNFTDKLTDGVHREADCSGGRKQFLGFDPKTLTMSNLTCGSDKILSKDCTTCVAGKVPLLNPPHSTLLYDDMICQFEPDISTRLKQPPVSYCTVAGQVVRECKGLIENTVEKITWVLLKDKVIFLEGHSVVWREGPFYSLFDCKQSSAPSTQCELTKCKEGKCTGDASFCSQFQCAKENPECRCTRNQNPGILHVSIGDNLIVPSCFGHSKWVVQRSRKLLSVMTQKNCVDCSVECKVDSITVVVRNFDPGYYQACLGPVCYTGLAQDKEFSIPIHPMSRISTEDVAIMIWSKTKNEKFNLESSCHHLSACDLINCFFCKANWVNLHCFRTEKWIMIAIAASITCILLGIFLKALQRIVMFFVWVFGPLVWVIKVLIKASGIRMFRGVSSAKEALHRLDVETGTAARTEAPQTRNSGTDYFSRKKKILLAINLITIITPVKSCSDTVMLSSLSRDCIQTQPNKFACTFSTSTLIPAAPIGQHSCIMLTSQSGEVLGIMKIKTVEARLSCLKSDLYWTPKATHQCLGSRRCRLVGDCHDDACMRMTENDFSSEWGARETVMNRLGWSSCTHQCGGILCGCFNVNPSCFYLRKTFVNPESLVFKAFECSAWTHSLKISIIFNGTSQDLTLMPDVSQKSHWGKVQLNSISSAPNLGFSECFFEAQNGDIFHGPCNRKGEVVMGKLGEIQCPTSSDAMTITPNCFSDQSVIHHQITQDVVHCSSNLLDPKELMRKNKLPATIGTTIFYPAHGGVYASSADRVSASILVKLSEVTVSSITDRNKCFTRFVNLTGCYNCESGAILRLETVTDFGTADAVLKCPDLPLITYFISTSHLQITEIIIHTNKSKVSTVCSCDCPNSHDMLTIAGELAYLTDVDFRHHNETTTPIVQRGRGGIDWFGWFKFSWMRWIWSILGFGGVVAAAIIGFFVLRMICCKSKVS
ncbi:envelope glycoprotein [Toyo virus]|uniref:Envelopment polyprotein n=1 Tax=Toyo virus TaxID=2874031 RepID=A0ABM7PPN6_9VIRU|nr:envelope glycoprotein [Toyo virus]BCT55141.1 envelope glycoprotein [Toyo virus]